MPSRYPAKPWQLAALLVLFFIIWVLWSGLYKPLLFGLGFFSCLISVWLAKRMGFFRHAMPLGSMLRLPRLWAWLLVQVIKSSLEVAKIILTPSLPIQPELVKLTTEETRDMGKVILGNAITLSPGTVTIDMFEDQLLVHCLTANSADDLRSGEAEARVAQLGLK